MEVLFILQILAGCAFTILGLLLILMLSIPFIELYQNINKCYYIKDVYLKINNFEYIIRKWLITGSLTTVIYFGVLSSMWCVGGLVLSKA